MGVTERRLRERARRREDLLDAAERLFAERGVAPTTVEDVAAAAEVGKGTLYLYFENKDALFGAVAGRALDAILARAEEVVTDAPSGLDGVRALLDAHLEHTTTHPWKTRILLSSLERGAIADMAGPALAGYRSSLTALQSLATHQIRRGQRDGSVRGDLDPPLAWLQLWANTLGVLVLLLHREEMQRRVPFPIEPGALLRAHVDFQLRGLAPAPSPPGGDPTT